jgi:class 3 adenylate cyclase
MAETENLPQPDHSIPDDQKTSRAFPQDEPAPLSWVSLPSGTVTFLFTDIEDSTPLWERNPQAMQAALQVHHALLTQAIENHQGVAFKYTGDGIEAAFPLASQALLAALDAQHILAEAEWNELGPLKVRMGLHTGEAQPDLNLSDYFTPAAPRAQRVMSAGHGGQILLSQETADLCRRSLPEGIFLKDLGLHRLKGLPEAERIFQVVAPGMRLEFPQLKTLDRFPHNLPVQLTSFIGREKETAEVLHLLNNTRLLTLSGVGGTGKTRLGLHVAE